VWQPLQPPGVVFGHDPVRFAHPALAVPEQQLVGEPVREFADDLVEQEPRPTP
jgi:hypothetical protein